MLRGKNKQAEQSAGTYHKGIEGIKKSECHPSLAVMTCTADGSQLILNAVTTNSAVQQVAKVCLHCVSCSDARQHSAAQDLDAAQNGLYSHMQATSEMACTATVPAVTFGNACCRY